MPPAAKKRRTTEMAEAACMFGPPACRRATSGVLAGMGMEKVAIFAWLPCTRSKRDVPMRTEKEFLLLGAHTSNGIQEQRWP